MEASALHAPSLTRVPLGAPLLRLRSDEQLLALFRAGSEEAFGALHERYRQRLFAYTRQMLSPASRQDAEDVLQDVFVRAYGALRADDREVNVRAWLYRVAHNRCIDHLRRPTPPASEIFEMSRKPLHDPIEEAQRREDLARLVEDVGRLPEQQRSALLMREIDGMSYADLATALDVTVPAVKSLLVRARVGLVESAEARDADCCEIRDDLLASYDRGVKASGRARKHMRGCAGCRDYRTALRGMRRSFAALTPAGVGGVGAVLANVLGIGGGGAAAGAGAGASGAAGGSAAAVASGTIATATACKVAAVVCTAALMSGGAVEVTQLQHHRAARAASARTAAPPAATVAAAPIAAIGERPALHRMTAAPVAPVRPAAHERAGKAKSKHAENTAPTATTTVPVDSTGTTTDPTATTTPVTTSPGTTTTQPTSTGAGGAAAPDAGDSTGTTDGSTAPSGSGTTAPAGGTSGSGSTSGPTTPGGSGTTGSDPATTPPPSEH